MSNFSAGKSPRFQWDRWTIGSYLTRTPVRTRPWADSTTRPSHCSKPQAECRQDSRTILLPLFSSYRSGETGDAWGAQLLIAQKAGPRPSRLPRVSRIRVLWLGLLGLRAMSRLSWQVAGRPVVPRDSLAVAL